MKVKLQMSNPNLCAKQPAHYPYHVLASYSHQCFALICFKLLLWKITILGFLTHLEFKI